MTQQEPVWLATLSELATEFCEAVAVIKGPPDLRPWNADQVLWAGRQAPSPGDELYGYYPLGDGPQVAILGAASRWVFSRLVEAFASHPSYGGAYGESFLRDMLVGLLQLSLPDAALSPLPSPYWKRYVAPAVEKLRAGSPQRYAEAVTMAVKALPVPHPRTAVVLPLAGVYLLGPRALAGVTLLPEAACKADPDLGTCGMFLHRLKDLQGRDDGAPVTFAKVYVAAEPGLAVLRAVERVEQLCRLLRLLPNPGLADGPLTDPPRIDLDAADSAAFYIAETSVGTHPIPLRRSGSEPQGKLGHFRVEPALDQPAWRRLASLVELGPRSELEGRLLSSLRYLGDAMSEPSAAMAVGQACLALDALLGAPDGAASVLLPSELAGALAGRTPERRRALRDQHARLDSLASRLRHNLHQVVPPQPRAEAIWLAFEVLKALAERPELTSYADLVAAAHASGA